MWHTLLSHKYLNILLYKGISKPNSFRYQKNPNNNINDNKNNNAYSSAARASPQTTTECAKETYVSARNPFLKLESFFSLLCNCFPNRFVCHKLDYIGNPLCFSLGFFLAISGAKVETTSKQQRESRVRNV